MGAVHFLGKFVHENVERRKMALWVALSGLGAVGLSNFAFSGDSLWRLAASMGLMVIGLALCGLALGIYLKKDYARKFTQIADLAWIICGAVGVATVFIDSFLVPTSGFLEARWKEIDFQVEHYRLNERVQTLCPDLSKVDVLHPCAALDRAIRLRNIPMRIAGAKRFLAHYQLEFDDVPQEVVRFAKSLESIGNSHEYAMAREFKDLSKPMLWQFVVVIAIGFRLAKALIDVFLL